jgi:hypothetical protein
MAYHSYVQRQTHAIAGWAINHPIQLDGKTSLLREYQVVNPGPGNLENVELILEIEAPFDPSSKAIKKEGFTIEALGQSHISSTEGFAKDAWSRCIIHPSRTQSQTLPPGQRISVLILGDAAIKPIVSIENSTLHSSELQLPTIAIEAPIFTWERLLSGVCALIVLLVFCLKTRDRMEAIGDPADLPPQGREEALAQATPAQVQTSVQKQLPNVKAASPSAKKQQNRKR